MVHPLRPFFVTSASFSLISWRMWTEPRATTAEHLVCNADGAFMTYEHQPGDRVRLTRAAVAFYGGAWPHFVPQGQGGGSAGTVLIAEDRPHKPGAAPRPYYVRWDNGVENSYRVEDLEAIPDRADTPASNVVPFLRPK